MRRATWVGCAKAERPELRGRSPAGETPAPRVHVHWMTSLANARCARSPAASACGGRPRSAAPRRSDRSFEGGAQRAKRLRRAFTSSWMTSLANARCARRPTAVACGGRPRSAAPRRSDRSFEGGAQRAKRLRRAFTSSWMTSLANARCARSPAAIACGGRPRSAAPRRSGRSFEGGAQRAKRLRRASTSSWMTSLGSACAPPRCARSPTASACGGRPGSAAPRRSDRSFEGGAQRVKRLRRAFTSSWMTSLANARLRRATSVGCAEAERPELRRRSQAGETPAPCVHVKLDDFARKRSPRASACGGRPGSAAPRRSG